MTRFLAALFLSLVALTAHAADDKMLFVEIRAISPQIPSTSFDAQPRKIWRVGEKYLRLEDAYNPTTKIHALIIVNEPDIWVMDRTKNQAKHILDPGPVYAVRLPVFPAEQSEPLKKLEIGGEMKFFQDNGAKELPSEAVDGVQCKLYRLELDKRELTLYVKPDNLPLQVAVQTATYGYAIRYLKYQSDLKPDLSLFKLPDGVELLQSQN